MINYSDNIKLLATYLSIEDSLSEDSLSEDSSSEDFSIIGYHNIKSWSTIDDYLQINLHNYQTKEQMAIKLIFDSHDDLDNFETKLMDKICNILVEMGIGDSQSVQKLFKKIEY